MLSIFRCAQGGRLSNKMLFRLRQLILAAVVFVSLGLLFTSNYSLYSYSENVSSPPIYDEANVSNINVVVSGGDDNAGRSKDTQIGSEKKNLIAAETCNIPHLDINGSEVRDFFFDPKPLGCSENAEKNWLFLNEERQFELTKERKNAKCVAVYFSRLNDQENSYGTSVDVEEGTSMLEDFAKVTCRLGKLKWSGLLMSAVVREDVQARLSLRTPPPSEHPMNVFFLGFDSLSQMSFRRKLPKTVAFLENVLGSVVLNGYNIVGDGTPQAFIPILTAQTEVELPLTRKRYPNANYVDDVYPFIWKNFSDNGYATLYAEDAFNIGTFTYRLKGFRSTPTDHYTPTFFKEKEKTSNWDCLGSEPLYESWFLYARDFMRAYADHPRFLLMHQSLLSHDDINKVQVEDEYLADFLQKMLDEGHFDNSLVVVMGDHGHRFAKLRNTHQGQLEERLPFFSLALPKKFRESEEGAKYYQNLVQNKERLTTPFDIHATLMDLLYPPSPSELVDLPNVKEHRSLSLFRPIPANRTCAQAGVEPHWCTCLNWEDAMTSESDQLISQKLAQVVVNSINEQLKNVKNLCATLRLSRVISAKKLIPNSGLLKYKNVKDADGFVPDLSGSTTAAFAHYQIKLQTTPGTAIYEVTMFYDFLKNTVHLDLTSLSHVNKFGDDPHCIISKNYFLATYCVCHDRV